MEAGPIEFTFKSIQIADKWMAKRPENMPSDLFMFEIKVDVKVNAEQKLVMPFVLVTITNEDFRCAHLTAAFIFEIVDFDKHIKKNQEGLYDIPVHLERLLRPVCISTCRGILWSELKATYLHNAIMPIVLMDKFQDLDKTNREKYVLAADTFTAPNLE